MIIEQDQSQIKNAVAFHTRAAIRSLRLVQSKAWNRRSAPDKIPAATFDIQFRPTGVHVGPECLTIETDFTFVVTEVVGEPSPTQESQEPLIFIDCRFEAQYSLNSDYHPSDDEIEAFRAANAVFNCWPYFREYVQSTVARMGFPPPAIPFLRLGRALQSEASGPEQHAQTPSARDDPASTKQLRPRRRKPKSDDIQ